MFTVIVLALILGLLAMIFLPGKVSDLFTAKKVFSMAFSIALAFFMINTAYAVDGTEVEWMAKISLLISKIPEYLQLALTLLTAIIAVAMVIPGDQPEKFLQSIVDFISKFSKKPKE